MFMLYILCQSSCVQYTLFSGGKYHPTVSIIVSMPKGCPYTDDNYVDDITKCHRFRRLFSSHNVYVFCGKIINDQRTVACYITIHSNQINIHDNEGTRLRDQELLFSYVIDKRVHDTYFYRRSETFNELNHQRNVAEVTCFITSNTICIVHYNHSLIVTATMYNALIPHDFIFFSDFAMQHVDHHGEVLLPNKVRHRSQPPTKHQGCTIMKALTVGREEGCQRYSSSAIKDVGPLKGIRIPDGDPQIIYICCVKYTVETLVIKFIIYNTDVEKSIWILVHVFDDRWQSAFACNTHILSHCINSTIHNVNIWCKRTVPCIPSITDAFKGRPRDDIVKGHPYRYEWLEKYTVLNDNCVTPSIEYFYISLYDQTYYNEILVYATLVANVMNFDVFMNVFLPCDIFVQFAECNIEFIYIISFDCIYYNELAHNVDLFNKFMKYYINTNSFDMTRTQFCIRIHTLLFLTNYHMIAVQYRLLCMCVTVKRKDAAMLWLIYRSVTFVDLPMYYTLGANILLLYIVICFRSIDPTSEGHHGVAQTPDPGHLRILSNTIRMVTLGSRLRSHDQYSTYQGYRSGVLQDIRHGNGVRTIRDVPTMGRILYMNNTVYYEYNEDVNATGDILCKYMVNLEFRSRGDSNMQSKRRNDIFIQLFYIELCLGQNGNIYSTIIDILGLIGERSFYRVYIYEYVDFSTCPIKRDKVYVILRYVDTGQYGYNYPSKYER